MSQQPDKWWCEICGDQFFDMLLDVATKPAVCNNCRNKWPASLREAMASDFKGRCIVSTKRGEILSVQSAEIVGDWATLRLPAVDPGEQVDEIDDVQLFDIHISAIEWCAIQPPAAGDNRAAG